MDKRGMNKLLQKKDIVSLHNTPEVIDSIIESIDKDGFFINNKFHYNNRIKILKCKKCKEEYLDTLMVFSLPDKDYDLLIVSFDMALDILCDYHINVYGLSDDYKETVHPLNEAEDLGGYKLFYIKVLKSDLYKKGDIFKK